MVDDNSRSKEGLVIEDVESMTIQGVAPKDTKTKLGSMSIDQFLKENGSADDEDENIQNGSEEAEQYVGDGNTYQDEDGELNEKEGTKKKRTRGPTQCLAIHGRSMQDRPEVVLDADGEPIGPIDKIVTDLSYFLGTIARNSTFCPLVYTSFKALLKDKDNKAHIWTYVLEKFNISDKGEKVVFTRINDAWRRYKSFIKKKHFSKYSTFLSEAHFKKLLKYWNISIIQSISERNAANRAKQKYIHRMGPTSFARIHADLRTKKEVGEKVTQAEMFITTRQRQEGRKGKELDEETHNVIIKLQGSIQNSSDSVEQTFKSLFGKEKPGRVRCYRKTMKPSQFRKNEEIAAIKKEHTNAISGMEKKIQDLRAIVNFVVRQQNPDLDEKDLNNMMAHVLGKESSATGPYSSASTDDPQLEDNENHEDNEGYEDYEDNLIE
ncbi:uncharacterized protein LOC114188556 [Vigna unguiculata]|uniref:uncharacterized protein LOC114172466 n=1 Tax=Vigna unguiculata TaxID=3917 RepID=UPI0010160C53|nr:uncharacterized protein LOC114172466 [Vigna unguiculata]XP_027932932.1 uncharacterized protein LOC114188556 [Vigna unguiculata]